MESKLKSLEFGAIYSGDKTTFRVYSPPTKDMVLRVYKDYNGLDSQEYTMEKHQGGYFEYTVLGDLDGFFYTYLIDGHSEVTDPYCIGASINSKRSAVVDLNATNPNDWERHSRPNTSREDAIIYELHVKDYTFNENSGVYNRGKYLGMTEKNRKYKNFSTGLDHLVELGVTHVHFLPLYDFLTVREEPELFYEDGNYNWGYDPELFNVPEGSYAVDPIDPHSRIRELKSMIMALHENGIKVVLDMVYNHSYRGGTSNFEALYPGYYYRMYNGSFSNGAGVGNEFDTEKPMFRKFILDSVRYWIEEFKIDGMRFDLMALIDVDTMKEVVSIGKEYDEEFLVYGEPWSAGLTTLRDEKMLFKGRQKGLGMGVFNDTFRDGLKGNDNGRLLGFAMGNSNNKICVETGILGSIFYDSLHCGFASDTRESINYVNAHDDLILYDEITSIMKNTSEELKNGINRVALGVILTSFGIPFIHEGNEFLRSKYMIRNTYNSPISINQVDWSLKEKNYEEYLFYKDLIEFRKKTKIFNLTNPDEIRDRVAFVDFKSFPIIGYLIKKDDNSFFLVVHSALTSSLRYSIDSIEDLIKSYYGIQINKKVMRIAKVFDKNGIYRKSRSIQRSNIFIHSQTTEIYFINLEENLGRR